MLLNVAWKDIDRAVPYIGWLSSDEGQTNVTLKDGQQDVFVSTTVRRMSKHYCRQENTKLDLI
jgi:translocation and assembly module TamB